MKKPAERIMYSSQPAFFIPPAQTGRFVAYRFF